MLSDTTVRIQKNIVDLTNEKENKIINGTYIPFINLAQPPTDTNKYTRGVVKAAEEWETAISENGQKVALTHLATSLRTLELYGLEDISTDIDVAKDNGGTVATLGGVVPTITSKTSDEYKALETYAKTILKNKPTTLAEVQVVIDSSLEAAELERKAKETVQELIDLEAATTNDGSYTNTQTAKLAQDALVKANGLVAQLPAGDTKTDLEGKINTAKTTLVDNIETHAKEAVAALFTEELGETEADKANITKISIADLKDSSKYNINVGSQLVLDQTLAAIELLPAETLRTALNVRLNVAQERFDNQDDTAKLNAAKAAVKGLFTGVNYGTSAGDIDLSKSVTEVRNDVRNFDADSVVHATTQTVINQAAAKVAELKDSVAAKEKLQMVIDTYEELVARKEVASLIDGVNAKKADAGNASVMTTNTLVGDVTWDKSVNTDGKYEVKSQVIDEKSFDDATKAVNNLTNSGSLAVKTRLSTFLNAAKAEYAKDAVADVYQKASITFDTILADKVEDLKDEALVTGTVEDKSKAIAKANKAVALVADAGIKANLQSKVNVANVTIINLAVNSESNAVEALKTLDNDNLINLGVQGGKEASALLFATRTDDNGNDPQKFTTVAEADQALEATIADYKSKLSAINEATTVSQMQTALNAVQKGYKGAAGILAGDFGGKFSSPVSISDAETVLTNLNALKNPANENIKGRSFKSLKDVVENGFSTPATGSIGPVNVNQAYEAAGAKSTVTVPATDIANMADGQTITFDGKTFTKKATTNAAAGEFADAAGLVAAFNNATAGFGNATWVATKPAADVVVTSENNVAEASENADIAISKKVTLLGANGTSTAAKATVPAADITAMEVGQKIMFEGKTFTKVASGATASDGEFTNVADLVTAFNDDAAFGDSAGSDPTWVASDSSGLLITAQDFLTDKNNKVVNVQTIETKTTSGGNATSPAEKVAKWDFDVTSAIANGDKVNITYNGETKTYKAGLDFVVDAAPTTTVTNLRNAINANQTFDTKDLTASGTGANVILTADTGDNLAKPVVTLTK